MVHALQEARRVLKPGGILIELRPAPIHRRVWITSGGGDQLLGAMSEVLDDDRAANQAVAEVLRSGLFTREWRIQFPCDRVMNNVEDFAKFLETFAALGKKLPSHDILIRRLESAYRSTRGRKRIVVRAPLVLNLLRKS